MSKLTDFQIYAMIRRIESSIEMHDRAGNKIAARRSRKKLAEYQRELDERIAGRVANGERMPEQFAEVR